MATTTPNFSLIEPAVLSSTDANLWGGMLNTNSTNLDAFLTSLTANFAGTSTPVLGTTASPTSGQWWVNTTGSTWPLNIYDGTSWVLVGTINPTTHTFAPVTSLSLVLNPVTFKTAGTFTYTPSANLVYLTVEVQGGGGGGAATITGTPINYWSQGGAGGGYGKSLLAAASVLGGVTVTVGAGGAGGTSSPIAGANGGNSSFGALITATGGAGGVSMVAGTVFAAPAPGSSTGGNLLNLNGGFGAAGYGGTGPTYISGSGGSGIYGNGGAPWVACIPSSSTVVNGNNGQAGTGGGGGGGISSNGSAVANGGNGASGCIIITEFIS